VKATSVPAMSASPTPVSGIRRAAMSTLRRLPIHVTLVGLAFIWIVPSLGVVVTSIRPSVDISSSGWWTVFTAPRVSVDNYREVLGSFGFVRAFFNSIFITVPSTILPIAIGSLAAYAFAWLRFPGRKTIFLIVVALMVLPVQAAFVPVLQLFSAFGLNRSFLGIWLAHTAFGLPFAIFLLRGFFTQLPIEILEAAEIDGASRLRVFWQVVLPLSRPALASLAVFQFLWVWNDLLTSLVFISNPNLQPLTVHTALFLTSYGQRFDLLSASSVLLMIVPLVLFLSLQRYFVRGIVAGAVK
jgi:alpha-glucoside transport system permease protein